MAKIPLGISLTETDEGFVIRRKDANRRVIVLRLSEEELAGLKETIDRWRDRQLSSARVGSGQVEPIVAHAVSQARVLLDALQQNILLSIRGPSGGESTLSIPRDVAEYIASEIPAVLLQAQPPSRRQ